MAHYFPSLSERDSIRIGESWQASAKCHCLEMNWVDDRRLCGSPLAAVSLFKMNVDNNSSVSTLAIEMNE